MDRMCAIKIINAKWLQRYKKYSQCCFILPGGITNSKAQFRVGKIKHFCHHLTESKIQWNRFWKTSAMGALRSPRLSWKTKHSWQHKFYIPVNLSPKTTCFKSLHFWWPMNDVLFSRHWFPLYLQLYTSTFLFSTACNSYLLPFPTWWWN